MELLNFNKYEQTKKSYGGSNANKFGIIINGEKYMVKLASKADRNTEISYSNSCISEYLGCHIYNLLGINAQDTLLGVYTHNDNERIAVACKDFEKDIQTTSKPFSFASLSIYLYASPISRRTRNCSASS